MLWCNHRHERYTDLKITSRRVKLKDVTFIRGEKPMTTLIWCDRQKRAGRCKPAKINGVLVSEVHEYYQPVN